MIKKEDGMEVAISCECREREVLRLQWKASGINLENCKQTFSAFKEWNPIAKKAKSMSIAYVKNFKIIQATRQNSILLCGQAGSGKSHLAIASALNLIRDNFKVVYMPYRDAVTKLKQNIVNGDVYTKLINRYKKCNILVIDDLYKGKINETDVNIVFEIINYRYLNYLPIIVSTEFTVDELLSFDEAIGSRVYEMCKNYTIEIEKGRERNYRVQ